MNPRMQKVLHTLAAIVAGALVILPDLLPLLADYPRASRIVGAILLILTNAKKVPVFAAMIDKFTPTISKPSSSTPVVR